MRTDSLHTVARLLDNRPLADENFCLRLECPELAARITPGQFFMLRLPGRTDPLLGRPFALYDTFNDESGQLKGIDVGIHAVGKATSLLSELVPGISLELWGPLGNGFPEIKTKHLIQVAGGIGYTPFVAVSRAALQGKSYGQTGFSSTVEKASLIYGVRSKRFRADLSDWSELAGLDVKICTDDGSEGHHGLVTDVLNELLKTSPDEQRVVLTCGPLRMMQAVAALCEQHGVECWASLETPMACGFGACFSCVVPVKDEQAESGWDYRRSCVEGPVFPTSKLEWARLVT